MHVGPCAALVCMCCKSDHCPLQLQPVWACCQGSLHAPRRNADGLPGLQDIWDGWGSYPEKIQNCPVLPPLCPLSPLFEQGMRPSMVMCGGQACVDSLLAP